MCADRLTGLSRRDFLKLGATGVAGLPNLENTFGPEKQGSTGIFNGQPIGESGVGNIVSLESLKGSHKLESDIIRAAARQKIKRSSNQNKLIPEIWAMNGVRGERANFVFLVEQNESNGNPTGNAYIAFGMKDGVLVPPTEDNVEVFMPLSVVNPNLGDGKVFFGAQTPQDPEAIALPPLFTLNTQISSDGKSLEVIGAEFLSPYTDNTGTAPAPRDILRARIRPVKKEENIEAQKQPETDSLFNEDLRLDLDSKLSTKIDVSRDVPINKTKVHVDGTIFISNSRSEFKDFSVPDDTAAELLLKYAFYLNFANGTSPHTPFTDTDIDYQNYLQTLADVQAGLEDPKKIAFKVFINDAKTDDIPDKPYFVIPFYKGEQNIKDIDGIPVLYAEKLALGAAKKSYMQIFNKYNQGASINFVGSDKEIYFIFSPASQTADQKDVLKKSFAECFYFPLFIALRKTGSPFEGYLDYNKWLTEIKDLLITGKYSIGSRK